MDDMDEVLQSDNYPVNSTITYNLCTNLCCIGDEDKYKLQCVKCNRLVHYRCTSLPPYQLQMFMTSNYRKFQCHSCVVVDEYINNQVLDKSVSKYEEQIKSLTETIIVKEECIRNKEEELKKLRNNIDEDPDGIGELQRKKRKRVSFQENEGSFEIYNNNYKIILNLPTEQTKTR